MIDSAAPDSLATTAGSRRPGVAAVVAIAILGGAAVGLLGATGFGLVHVVGGALRGNPRAVSFGVELGLAAGTGAVLDCLALVRLVRRRTTGAG